MFKFLKKADRKLSTTDVFKFYTLQSKYNPLSDIIGMVNYDYKQALKLIKRVFDKSYKIFSNEENKSIVIVKDDFIEKYIILETLDDVINSKYKFRKYM